MGWFVRLNWPLVALVLALMAVSVVAIGKATGTALLEGDGAKQAVWAVISLAAMGLVLVPHYRHFERHAYTALAVLVPFLVVVLAGSDPIVPKINGARRWICLPGMPQFQPSELVKIAYICALAKYLMFRQNYRTFVGLLGPFALSLVPMALILKQPDLGMTLVFVPVLFAMLFAAGARGRHLLLVALLAAAVAPAFWHVMSGEQKSRVRGWLQQSDWTRPTADAGYQLWQSKLALGSGGMAGREDDADTWVELGYLPEARTDFIFSVIGESWGFLGCTGVLVLYWLVCVFGMGIALATKEPFGRLAAVGIVTLFAAQLFINAGMTVGLMPITGLTLPFLSYGGSSLLSNSIALGILLNIGSRKVLVIGKESFSFRD